MATKSKNNVAIFWSIVAIVIALFSIGYCFSVVLMILENGLESSTKMISVIARIIGRSFT